MAARLVGFSTICARQAATWGSTWMPDGYRMRRSGSSDAFPTSSSSGPTSTTVSTNPQGKQSAAKYRFPLEDQSFDTVYAASLLTHLLPGEVQHYFAECRRVLKSGGTCLFSTFVLDHYRGPGSTLTSMCEFDHPLVGHPGVAARDPNIPTSRSSVHACRLRQFAKDASLELVVEIPGLWSDATEWAVNEHDLILLQRP